MRAVETLENVHIDIVNQTSLTQKIKCVQLVLELTKLEHSLLFEAYRRIKMFHPELLTKYNSKTLLLPEMPNNIKNVNKKQNLFICASTNETPRVLNWYCPTELCIEYIKFIDRNIIFNKELNFHLFTSLVY